MGMPQAVMSPLSSVHGMYLVVGLADPDRVILGKLGLT